MTDYHDILSNKCHVIWYEKHAVTAHVLKTQFNTYTKKYLRLEVTKI